VLASTLCSDLVVSAVETAAGGGAIPAAFAAEATARQARMVAHEIRNTLVPVRSTLDSLYREVLVDAPDQVLKKRRPLIDRGVSRVFDFVEQLVRVASLAAIPPEPFDPAPAIRDAVAAVDAGAGISVKVLPGTAALPFVVGRRDRFVTALVNLIRNAIQHGGAGLTQIRLLAEPLDRGRALRLTIDDNGDGVPERMREAIFTDGISLSSDGTGLGLALVREVFERELKGVVVCEESPLGGARFRLRTPAAGVNG
jgi:signal transduction histidine kinase